MPFPTLLQDRQYCIPSAADGAVINFGAIPAWTNTPWVTLLASAPADGILTGVTVRGAFSGFPWYAGVNGGIEIDIGVGSSPTVIATFKQHFDNGGATNDGLYMSCPIGIDAIVSGEPVKARMRAPWANKATGNWHISATYLRQPLTGSLDTTTNVQYVRPSMAPHHRIYTQPVAWDSSPWSTIEVGGDRLVVGICVETGSAFAPAEIDFDLGSSVATIPIYKRFGTYPLTLSLPNPIRVQGDLRARVRGLANNLVDLAVVCVDYPL